MHSTPNMPSLLSLPQGLLTLIGSFTDPKTISSMRLMCWDVSAYFSSMERQHCLTLSYSRLTPEAGYKRLEERVLTSTFDYSAWSEVEAYCTSHRGKTANPMYEIKLDILRTFLSAKKGEEQGTIALMKHVAEGNPFLWTLEIMLLLSLSRVFLSLFAVTSNTTRMEGFLQTAGKVLCSRRDPSSLMALLLFKAGSSLKLEELPALDLFTLKVLMASGLKLTASEGVILLYDRHPLTREFVSQVSIATAILPEYQNPYLFQYAAEKLKYFSVEAGYQLSPGVVNSMNYLTVSRFWYNAPYCQEACMHRELSVEFEQRREIKRQGSIFRLGRKCKQIVVVPLLYLEGFCTIGSIILKDKVFRSKVLVGMELEECSAVLLEYNDTNYEGIEFAASLVLLDRYKVYIALNDNSLFPYPKSGNHDSNFMRGAELFCRVFRLKIAEYCRVL